ncbi:LmbE family protein [Chondrocystis sp. NIES-4102]|nr:LmbE family protein [Chondrocystis sp. NIES-4102]
MFPRKQLRDRYFQQINQLQPLSPQDLAASAIVFAPHQDDETLGCGGTIILKQLAAADTKIVFMTDGSRSHNHLIPQAELVIRRQKEALDAAKCLGLKPDQVIFLGFGDGELQQAKEQAKEKVVQLLLAHQPQQVFIPYVRETHRDHLATNQIVLAALAHYPQTINIYEYPVWYWHHFPWTKPWGDRSLKLAYLKASIKAKLGRQLLQEFNYRVDINTVKTQKKQALAQHQTQMERLIDDPSWGILKDVSEGEWLECFFQNIEIFRRTTNKQ